MRSILPVTLAFALAAGAAAQDFYPQQIDSLRIKFVVNKKLAAVPLMLGEAGPHLRARYKPEDDSDRIAGRFSWELFVLEFPAKAPEDGARDFEDWVHNKDVGISQRTFVTDNKQVGARGDTPAHRFYEYYDPDDRFGYWYRVAAVYELDGREVALMANIPAVKDPKPSDTYLDRVKRMVTSLEPLAADEVAAAGGDAELDKHADTDERRAALAAARQNIANVDHWSYFTTPNYIVLYSWDPEHPEQQRDGREFADELVGELEEFRATYAELFPPHERMQASYPILRICADDLEFQQYGGPHSKDREGWYNVETDELVMFHDKTRQRASVEDIKATCLHEAWHQYASNYFGKRFELHPWFDEGIGEYFGSFSKRGKKWRYEPLRFNVASVKRRISARSHVPLRDFVTWQKDKFRGENAADFQAQAHALVDFLQRGPEKLGRRFDQRWTRILDTYRSTVLATKNRNKALQAAFEGVDWDAFEDAWIAWAKTKMK